MKEEDKKLWLELYEITKKIQDLKPWYMEFDRKMLVYESDILNDTFYIVFARAENSDAKYMYIYQGENILEWLTNEMNQYPDFVALNYDNCIECSFAPREDISPENIEIIKEIGLKFRGTWIGFESYSKEYESSPLIIKEVRGVIEILKNCYNMLLAINDKKVDLPKGKILSRKYDKTRKAFVNEVLDTLEVNEQLNVCGIDKSIKRRLTEMEETNMELEFDFLSHLPLSAETDEYGRSLTIRMRVIADKKRKKILSSEIIKRKDFDCERDYEFDSIDELIDRFDEFGIPKIIYVRDNKAEAILSDLAEKAGIKLIVSKELDVIDNMYNLLINGTIEE